jgi:glycosyltransferase involved in cell wall biosynthesis
MKILMVTLGFYPSTAWGGPTTVVYQNALELQRRGHQVTVCTSNRLNKQQTIAVGCFEKAKDGLRVSYLHTYMLKNWPGTAGPTWLSTRGFRKLRFEISQADIVHVHGTRNILSLASAWFAARQNKPLVLQPHGTLPRIVSSVRLKQVFDQVFMGSMLGQAQALIALQNSEVQQIIDTGGDLQRITVVPNGLDNAAYNPHIYQGLFRKQFGVRSDCQLVLFLGRINRKKGPDLLVEAFARLPERARRQTRLVIAGPDDGQLAEVQALVERYRLEEQVIFTGLLSGEMVSAAHADADLFVLPCRVDTFPMAILEACQAGTPMVVTETCEIADMLDGQVATIVPVDPAPIAAAMAELLQDAGLRQRYRQSAQQLMKTAFSIEAVGEQLEAVYTRVIEACQSD